MPVKSRPSRMIGTAWLSCRLWATADWAKTWARMRQQTYEHGGLPVVTGPAHVLAVDGMARRHGGCHCPRGRHGHRSHVAFQRGHIEALERAAQGGLAGQAAARRSE